MIYKTLDLKALDIDTTNRKVKVAISQMGTEDRDEDIIDFGAYDLTIAAKGPKGSNEVWHLTDHGWRIADSALSKYEELGVQGDLLYGVAPYRDTWLWRECAWPLYEKGDINQHSVGFRIVRQELQQDGPRIIKEIELWEGSAVLWGAQPNTPVMDLIKSHLEHKQESFEDRVKWIIKAIKNGKYKEDESLLVLELKQLESLHTNAKRLTGNPTQETDMGAQQLSLAMKTILMKY
jgi:phage head maturation protease